MTNTAESRQNTSEPVELVDDRQESSCKFFDVETETAMLWELKKYDIFAVFQLRSPKITKNVLHTKNRIFRSKTLGAFSSSTETNT